MKSKKNSRLKNRRGVADIISTMMLMAVTVTGASTLTYFMNDAFVSGNLGSVSSLDSSSLNLLLLAYDTRDSSSLLTLNSVDNENTVNSFLCGVTCSINSNKIPNDILGGTEFIVLQIQNNGLNSIFLQDVGVSNVVHSWDPLTADVQLDASTSAPLSGKYPADGMFSILPTNSVPIIQKSSMEIQNGEIVNILVKLGPDDSDIALNKGISVSLNTGNSHLTKFLINSGDAR
jgi:hypothetical protein